MKKTFWFLLTIAVIGFMLTACRGSSDPKNSSEDPVITTEREVEGGSLETGDGFGFTYFQLTIDVDNEEAVHIRYDVEDTAEATYVDHTKNIDVTETQAMDQSGAFFQNVRVQKGVPAKKMMEDILNFYRIEQFSNFDLLVRFDDETEMRIQESGEQ
ncbi:MAG TPA: YusW family protein [Sporosarcina sp.]|nr:YusW family protein [Sporosarcina sp.]